MSFYEISYRQEKMNTPRINQINPFRNKWRIQTGKWSSDINGIFLFSEFYRNFNKWDLLICILEYSGSLLVIWQRIWRILFVHKNIDYISGWQFEEFSLFYCSFPSVERFQMYAIDSIIKMFKNNKKNLNYRKYAIRLNNIRNQQ